MNNRRTYSTELTTRSELSKNLFSRIRNSVSLQRRRDVRYVFHFYVFRTHPDTTAKMAPKKGAKKVGGTSRSTTDPRSPPKSKSPPTEKTSRSKLRSAATTKVTTESTLKAPTSLSVDLLAHRKKLQANAALSAGSGPKSILKTSFAAKCGALTGPPSDPPMSSPAKRIDGNGFSIEPLLLDRLILGFWGYLKVVLDRFWILWKSILSFFPKIRVLISVHNLKSCVSELFL